MAQVVPSLTSLPIDSTVAPSAEDIQNHLPSICVDYLSHDWAEEDVWASWRSMTRHKNEIANGVRLENASWRTWWKQRNKLKTISPETLNWLKDSDVTWLYGPLHTAVEPVPPPKVATAEERLGLSRADSSATTSTAAAINATKPILKHRTLSEMLSIPNPSSPILEATRVEGDMEDGDWDSTTGRPALMHTKSDTNIVTKGSSRRRGSPPRGPVSGSSGERTPVDHSLPSSGARTPTEGVPMSGGLGLPGGQPGVTTPNTANARKHISFNTFVEQRIAVDDPDEIERIERRTDEGVSDDELDEDEEGAMLEMKSVSSASSVRTSSTRSGRPSISRASSNASSTADHMTTAKIAPTTLKHLGTFPSPSPQLAYAPKGDYASAADEEAESSSTSSSGNNVTYRHQPTGGYSVSHHENNDEDDDDEADIPGRSVPQGQGGPNSVVSPTWDDEDDYSVGFDYFSGPDLGVGDEYDTKRGDPQSGLGQQAGTATRAVQSHVGGTASYGKGSSVGQGTTVGQPPAAPKWRSGSNSNSTSTSSSGSNTPSATPKKGDNSTSSPTGPEFAIASPPQPGRSILKIRPPGSSQPYEPESPTNTHFNWKPSAATGLGGLDQGVRRVIKEPVAGSLPLYDVNDSYFGQTGSGGSGLETPPLLPGGSPSSPTVAMGSRDGESRGRSAVRTGSNLAERSASRTASTPSASTSPNSSRAAAVGPTTSKQTKQENSALNKSSSSGLEEHVNEKETAAPQVQRPIGMAGGGMPKDDVELKKEEDAKNRQEEEEAQLQAEAVAGQEEREREHEEDHRPEGYVLDRGSTPTPHSSPQVAIRPLADTSPASLPHVQTVQVPDKKRGAVSAAEQSASTLKAQNSVTAGMGTRRHQRSPSMPSNTGSGPGSGSRFFRSVSNQHQQRSASQHQGVAEDDGGLMSNLASTAKDLFGALWTYGGQANGNGNNSNNNNSTVQANETENGDARSRAESTKST